MKNLLSLIILFLIFCVELTISAPAGPGVFGDGDKSSNKNTSPPPEAMPPPHSLPGGMPVEGMPVEGMPVGGMPIEGMPMGGMPMGGPTMMNDPNRSRNRIKKEKGYSTGGAMWKEYNCGETNSQTDKVLESIKSFQSMVSNMAEKEICNQVNQALNNTIPAIEDIRTAMASSAMAQEIKKYKQEFRDIELALQNNPNQNLNLMGRKMWLQTRLSQLEARFSVSEKGQIIKQYETAINTTDDYFSKITNAVKNDCFSDGKTKTQAMLSLAGIAGLVAGATPLGAGVSAVTRLLGHVQNINDQYDTKDLDDISLYAGLKCALRNMQNQHCDIVKNHQLHTQKETEAKSCSTNCLTDNNDMVFHRDITSVQSIIGTLSSEDKDQQNNQDPDPTQFVSNFLDYNNNYEKGLNNLQAFTQNIDQEFLDQVGQGSRKDCKELRENHYKCAVLNKDSAETAIQQIKQAYDIKEQGGFLNNADKHKSFVSTIKSAFTPDHLENLTHLMIAYTDYQQDKIDNYRQNNSSSSVPNAEFLKYMTHFAIDDLLNLSSSGLPSDKFRKVDDMNSAYTASNKLQESFSRIFTSHAVGALKTIKQDIKDYESNNLEMVTASEKNKNMMCINLIGLVDLSHRTKQKQVQSLQNKIEEQCENAEITLQDSNGVSRTLKYAHYKAANADVRACVFQNFLNCVDFPSESSPACIAYENSKIGT